MVDVSVVVPCYNAEPFIEDCIRSIAEQTGVSVEILAVEDRSSDRTWDMLCCLAKRFPALKLQRMNENSGQATARNAAMAMASGRYVALLDSDDSYRHPDVLRQWVAAADAGELDLCVAQYTTQFENGDQKHNTGVPLLQTPDKIGSALTSPEIANTAQSWQILFRQSFLTETGLKFSQKLRQREDRLFFIEAFCHAKRVSVIALDAILYRVHPGSTMRRRDYGQMAQFNLHMEMMSIFITQAREDRRISDDFERANAVAYWRQLMEYWNILLIPALLDDPQAHYLEPTEQDIEVANAFIALINKLTRHCGPFFLDQAIQKHGSAEAMKVEGVLDVARLVVMAERRELLVQLLRGQRLHSSDLRTLMAQTDLPWAEAAVMQYLRYSRSASIAQEKVTDETPHLASLVKRVILHVGTPKTGSSSLQEFLENNRFRLADQGIWYPVYGASRERGMRRNRTSGHLGLIRNLINNPGNDFHERRIAAEIASFGKPIHTVILSSENILSHVLFPENGTGLTPEGDPIGQIVKALGLEQVEVAMVLRRQDNWFQSYYRELLSNPYNQFLASPMTFFKNLEMRGLFDYDKLISHIAAMPWVSRLHVSGFAQMREAGGSIPWFLDILGHDGVDLLGNSALASNLSLTDAMAGNIRLLKLQHPIRGRVPSLFNAITTSQDLRDVQYSLITPDQWTKIDDRLAAGLAAFDKRFPGEKPSHRPASGKNALLPVLPVIAGNEPDHLWLGLTQDSNNPMAKHLSHILRDYQTLIDEHAYMSTSKSWSLTAPLRITLGAVKSIRNRLRK